MRQQVQAQVLTIYVGENDKYQSGLLFPAIVETLKEAGIAGVTVLRGMEGYGANGTLHTARFEALFEGMPIVIEAVDVPERIQAALPLLDEMIAEGLATVHDVTAVRFNKDPRP